MADQPHQPTYIGDGVYMGFDEDMIALRTTSNTIYLEREVFKNLIKQGARYFGYEVTVEVKP